MSIVGCGWTDHDEACLCDVVIDDTLQEVRVTIPYDYAAGPYIVRAMELGVPWTSGDLASFLDAIALAHDTLEEQNREKKAQLRQSTVASLTAMKDMIREGKQPTQIVGAIKARFDVDITRSYVCKTRRRMEARGEL